jgi:hypothetical protein
MTKLFSKRKTQPNFSKKISKKELFITNFYKLFLIIQMKEETKTNFKIKKYKGKDINYNKNEYKIK